MCACVFVFVCAWSQGGLCGLVGVDSVHAIEGCQFAGGIGLTLCLVDACSCADSYARQVWRRKCFLTRALVRVHRCAHRHSCKRYFSAPTARSWSPQVPRLQGLNAVHACGSRVHAEGRRRIKASHCAVNITCCPRVPSGSASWAFARDSVHVHAIRRTFAVVCDLSARASFRAMAAGTGMRLRMLSRISVSTSCVRICNACIWCRATIH